MTATSFTSDPGIQQTTATFRASAEGLNQALLTCGLTLTSDTGQVDLTTANVPAQNASAGYKVYRLNDSLTATAPIYLRIDFFVVNSSTLKPAFRFTFGTGTDGAGAITGALGGVRTIATQATTTVAASSVLTYVSAGEGYLTIALHMGTSNSNTAGMLILERHQNPSGAITAAGVIIVTTAALMDAYDTLTKTPRSHAYGIAYPFYLTTVAPILGVTPVFPMSACFIPGQTPWQPTSFLAVARASAPVGAFSATLNGVSRTYINLTAPNVTFVQLGSGLIDGCSSIRFE